jgi:di/tricarboxylate transporter
MAWMLVLAALVTSYCYIHYSFASMTAHITALYPGFFGAALAVAFRRSWPRWRSPYFSNLNAAMTHYGPGPRRSTSRRYVRRRMVALWILDIGNQSDHLAGVGPCVEADRIW